MGTTTKTINTDLTPSKVKAVLRHVIEQNMDLVKQKKEPVAFCIEGPAGASKTSICKQVAKEYDHHFVRLNVAEMEISD